MYAIEIPIVMYSANKQVSYYWIDWPLNESCQTMFHSNGKYSFLICMLRIFNYSALRTGVIAAMYICDIGIIGYVEYRYSCQ